ncbi:ABC transporter ATP-binding protein [Nocardioides sp. Bht2]|uniref:ABC transporter ATP-binding protein n=1 Tax=Nocardioides sp. Bht2 TaxID=3392297 RepID=UPI0039B43A0F
MTCGASLSTTGVSVRLGNHQALDDVTVHVPAGSVTGILGPNGSGKSTLLQVLGGLRRPDQGVVHLEGTLMSTIPLRHRAQHIGVLEQQNHAASELTVREVVALGRLPHRRRWALRPDPDGPAVVERALAQAHLTHLADRPWSTLSGGERQRTQLARALAQEPTILLLDEPTNHLDLGHQLKLLSLVRRLGLTCVVALHDLELATVYCDEVAVLANGRLVRKGPVADALSPALLAEVYGVRAAISPHPRLSREHLAWDDVLETP